MDEREIKFRYYVERENGHKFSQVFTIDEIERGDLCLWKSVNHIGDRSKITRCQYTGRKDRNGEEIYDGDVVVPYCSASTETGRSATITAEVIWDIENYQWALKVNNGECWWLGAFDLEIIGNVHEIV